jgi:hypothetical protein
MTVRNERTEAKADSLDSITQIQQAVDSMSQELWKINQKVRF